MLTIRKTDNQNEISAYCKANSVTIPAAPCQYMGMFEGETLCGLAAITLEYTKVYLDLIHAEGGTAIAHGLAKAILNMADLQGIKTVYGKNPDLESLYRLLRFSEDNGEFSLSLAGYFTAEEH